MPVPKRKIREAVIESIFQLNFFEIKLDELIENLNDICKEKKINMEEPLIYVKYIKENLSSIDKIIEDNLKNWSFDRIGNVEKSVLRLAIYEILEKKETPIKVIIDEAIELSKKYSEETSGKFVNGILDRIARKYERL
ncbi:N utilization substance protein B [Tepiditoga spiralis]|uniref:Transcription antitermination protein NusB n=1 Tax=Tepiditoga spiralis TaxID=2108365 RepID=A0A7G1G5K4_9BACT|nr:transcription antitermination factor NusB [Tepiditoga spiralis]BBE31858.1 N utilization substance protein B [Tepiditoga spiralis]